MRITSELHVAQLVRRLFAAGDFAVVARRGADQAGAIFIVARQPSGAFQLYGPAPQSLSEESGERRFILEPAQDEEALAARLASEARFDPDFWVVEIESRNPEQFVDIAAE
ncbi:DUF1491 family protein [Aurantimonas sp. A2-1-M11]|uniref:DUF1491 family protein n=1 Tax=Aurantimonas sp. A2-1-M11 TaxID=3113712 RepID=UPI002F92D3C4